MNSIEKYYSDQAGNGLAGFAGVKYQKGFGFFGRLLSGAVMPFLKFLGKSALNVGSNIAQDISDTNEFTLDNVKKIAKKRAKEAGSQMLKKAADKLMEGNGIKKRKYKRKVIKAKKIIKKSYKKKTSLKSKTQNRCYKRKTKLVRRQLKANDFL